MAYLDTHGGTLIMHGIGNISELRHNLISEPKLAIK
jgi:hypothetical protein